MKALCVKAPWSKMIAQKIKPHEIRTWHTKYRGPLLIVVSKIPDELAARQLSDKLKWPMCLMDFHLGCAICTCDLIDCRPMQPDDEKKAWCEFKEGLWVWELANVQLIYEPFPVKGQLGLFEVKMP